MRTKKTILAPIVLTLGSLSVMAGAVAPVVASASGSAAAMSPASSGAIGRFG